MASSLPQTMKAIGIQKHGDLDVIEQLSIPVPIPKDDHVLVKVHYAGVNFIDTYERSGLYPAQSFPKVLGQELTGTILALPTSRDVLENPGYTLRNLNLGDEVGALNPGAFAEYVCVHWTQITKLPSTVDPKLGAAVMLQGLTALTFATEAYEVKKGDHVLVYSGAGGVGTMLTQIATHKGAIVISTVSNDEKAQIAQAAGAQHVIVTSKQKVLDEVLRITDDQGVEGIFDGVGKDTFEDNFKIAKRKGTFVSYGNSSGPAPLFAPLKLVEKNLKFVRPKVMGYIVTPEEQFHYVSELFDLMAKGVVVPMIHGVYDFSAEGLQKAQQEIASRGTVGKLVVHVS